jgi:hypothetical protein
MALDIYQVMNQVLNASETISKLLGLVRRVRFMSQFIENALGCNLAFTKIRKLSENVMQLWEEIGRRGSLSDRGD